MSYSEPDIALIILKKMWFSQIRIRLGLDQGIRPGIISFRFGQNHSRVLYVEGCPVYGVIDQECSTHTFYLERGEYITSLEVRAGAWVDGIRFHSNMKSSIWFGGQGGDMYRMTPSDGETITGIFGTYGKYLGSLGVRLRFLTLQTLFVLEYQLKYTVEFC